MKSYPIDIKPFGENAILLEWPNKVEEEILYDILDFMDFLKSQKGVDCEMIPAYNSLTVICHNKSINVQRTKGFVSEYLTKEKGATSKRESSLWEIPVCYDTEFGFDLEEVTNRLSLSVEELIYQHTAQPYMVYGIGFLPGFMYLGGLPSSLELPRRSEPRLQVAKGSVGLAGKQTGIYPQTSPGGWNIIGNCPISIFNPKSDPPCIVKVGDKIKFRQIERAEYDLHKIEAEVGIFKLKRTALHG